jgi:hypothetical protein
MGYLVGRSKVAEFLLPVATRKARFRVKIGEPDRKARFAMSQMWNSAALVLLME